jgi:hypothetical protein
MGREPDDLSDYDSHCDLDGSPNQVPLVQGMQGARFLNLLLPNEQVTWRQGLREVLIVVSAPALLRLILGAALVNPSAPP